MLWSGSLLVMSDSLWPHGLYNPWDSPGQNTRVGSCFLLQRIFTTQESNRGLLCCRRILYQLSYQGCVNTQMKAVYMYLNSDGSVSKESACITGDLASIPGLGRSPWRKVWQPTPVFLAGESPWTEEPGGLQSIAL